MKLNPEEITFKDWEMIGHDDRELNGIIAKIAKKCANLYLQDLRVYMPRMSDCGRNYEPLEWHIYSDDNEELLAKVSISDAIEFDISLCEEDGSYSEELRQVSLRMKELVARIDAAIEKHRPED